MVGGGWSVVLGDPGVESSLQKRPGARKTTLLELQVVSVGSTEKHCQRCRGQAGKQCPASLWAGGTGVPR